MPLHSGLPAKNNSAAKRICRCFLAVIAADLCPRGNGPQAEILPCCQPTSVGRFLSDARWGGSRNTHVLLEPPRRALSFSRLFRWQNKIPLIGGIYR